MFQFHTNVSSSASDILSPSTLKKSCSYGFHLSNIQAYSCSCISKRNVSSQNIYLQDIEVGLFRSDYFFCCANECIKQVEFNTIAASFGCLTSQLVRAYKYWNLVVDILLT